MSWPVHTMGSSQVAVARPTAAAYTEAVREALARAERLLPTQAPLGVFIALNTLQAFQHLPFHEALREARQILGAEPYLSEDQFRAHLESGRIGVQDLEAALADQLPSAAGPAFLDRTLDLGVIRMAMLRHAIRSETDASLDWMLREQRLTRRLRADVAASARDGFLSETERWLRLGLDAAHEEGLLNMGRVLTGKQQRADVVAALKHDYGLTLDRSSLALALERDPERFAVTALWHTCERLARGYRPAPEPTAQRLRTHREALLELTGEDAYNRVFPVLIRLSAAYLDEGLAPWSMPGRELGFYAAVRTLVAGGSALPMRWMEEARRDFRAQLECGASAMDAVADALEELGVPPSQAAEYLDTLLLTLPGWAGMMSRLERNPGDRAGGPPASLLDFVAVRLTYERAALRDLVRQNPGARIELREAWGGPRRPSRLVAAELDGAYRLFQLMQVLGVPVPSVCELSREDVHQMLALMDGFDELTRRRVFQEAFERHYRVQVLDALVEHRRDVSLARPAERPRMQFITCFDDREESLRRHIEELAPDCQTFGAPGFFGAAIRFRALNQRVHVPLAPVVITAVHHIDELPRHSDVDLHERRTKRLNVWAQVQRQLRTGSRSLWRGILLNGAFGLFAALPLLVRIASPRAAGRIQRWVGKLLLPPPRTALSVHQEQVSDGPKRGFKVDERVSRVATVLENIGLTTGFGKLVVLLGHGATTLNNPHASAYDCGACGGRQGGPNARVFAHMANDPEVRAGLRLLGIDIPDDTCFLGGQHDTCSEQVVFFDVDGIPASHRELYAATVELLGQARANDAQERCRRMAPFSAPVDPTPLEALHHVESRSEHLAEPRPELSHQANAMAVIGRRAVTRGLFLDRRAFVLSYDPTIDPDGKILERSMAAAVPVGAGINLQYYFSCVDNERYGSGSKLPHNIVGLIGVMSGHASDLRTGLPRQMIDVHEPQRLLLVVEATPERLLAIANNQPEIKELVVNRWVNLVSMDPDTGALQVFIDRGFEPYVPSSSKLPAAQSSLAFYHGRPGPLPPARIAPARTQAA